MKFEFLKSRVYLVISFLSGMSIMGVEMTASRILAPYFGTSVFIWTNLIGAIMIALSMGYFLGGRIIDKKPTREILETVLFFAMVILFLIPPFAPLVMQNISSVAFSGNVTLIIFSFITTIGIFGVPFLFLGMVSPMVIRLASNDSNTIGEVSGNIFAFSTFGSILGTFLPTLFLVPLIGSKHTILFFAFFLGIAQLLLKPRLRVFIALFVVSLLTIFISKAFATEEDIIYESESAYSYIAVKKTQKYGNTLLFNEGLGVQSFYKDDELFIGSYWEYIGPLVYLIPHKSEEILLLGGGGGSFARIIEAIVKDTINLEITAVEIDKSVIDIAKKYFNMDESITNYVESDARMFLKGTDEKYSFILVDTYSNGYFPPHLTTQEFYQEVKDHLLSNGTVVINMNILNEESSVYKRIGATLQSVFDSVAVFHVPDSYNYLYILSNQEVDYETLPSRIPLIAYEHALNIRAETNILDTSIDAKIITDDYQMTEVAYDVDMFRGFIDGDL